MPDRIITNGKIYERCAACGQLIRVNKPFVGSLHVCVEEPRNDYCDECGKPSRHLQTGKKEWGVLSSESRGGLGQYCPRCFEEIERDFA